MKGLPAMAQAPMAITSFGAGTDNPPQYTQRHTIAVFPATWDTLFLSGGCSAGHAGLPAGSEIAPYHLQQCHSSPPLHSHSADTAPVRQPSCPLLPHEISPIGRGTPSGHDGRLALHNQQI